MSYKGKFNPKFPSKYIGNPNNIIFRSAWERTFMEYCDTHSNITKWASEELKIPYYFPADGKWHHYYPDFLVQVKTEENIVQVWLVEIKPSKQTKLPTTLYGSKRKQLNETLQYAKNQAKWAAAKAFCSKKGWKFVILTEYDLYPKKPTK